LILLFLIFLTISFNIVYTPVTKVNLDDESISDAVIYLSMYQGHSLKEIPKPYRYRILVPYLARLIPTPPSFLMKGFDSSPEKVIKLKFGILNAIALAFAAWILFFFCRRLDFNLQLSILGSLLFLCSFYIVNYSGLPLTDASAFLFLTGCLYAILANNNWLLGLFFTVGIFAKETIVLAFVYIFFQNKKLSSKLQKFILCVPGLLSYLCLRFFYLPTNNGYNYTIDRLGITIASYAHGFAPWFWAAFNFLLVFGILWFFAWRGLKITLKEKDIKVLELLPILPVVIVVPFVIGSDLGRIWFLSYPVIIPMALKGINYYLIDPRSQLSG